MLAATITVSSTADTNARDALLTLREAILINNGALAVSSLAPQEQALVSGNPTSGGINTIDFNIPNSDPNHFYYQDDGTTGHITLANVAVTSTDDASLPASGAGAVDSDWNHSWFSIQPLSALPDITQFVIIDGYSQSGAQANANAVGQGLNTVLKIELSGAQAGLVDGGLLRVETGGGTEIRGLALNRAQGPEINLDTSCQNATVDGDFIGADISGIQAFAPPAINSPPTSLHSNGVLDNGTGNTIGGTTAAARNLISGNNLVLNQLDGAMALGGSSAVVQGNLIGTNRTGTAPLGNAGPGVLVVSPNNLIGAFGAGNVISGNDSVSISLASINATGTMIFSNDLGTDPTGTTAVGSTGGISIGSDATNNTIGRNTIAFGVGIINLAPGSGNLISQNSIFDNSGPGINIGNQGVIANDTADQDRIQNYPILDSVTSVSTGTKITGTLTSAPNSNFKIEFFANAQRDEDTFSNTAAEIPGQFGEGQTFIGFVRVSTDSNGAASFSLVFLGLNLLALGGTTGEPFVTSTAINVTGSSPTYSTSEFSPVAPLGGPSFVVTNTGDAGLGTLREAIINADLTPGNQTITFDIPASDPRHLYYQDDGIPGQVSLDHVATTTASDDSTIGDIDPDWAHSWFSILPTHSLPQILNTVTIDGYSQAGTSANTIAVGSNLPTGLNAVLKIELDGDNVAGDGLQVSSASGIGASGGLSTIQGLNVNRFGGSGIALSDSGANTIAGNFIGTDVSGTIPLGNGGSGVLLSNDVGSTVGGKDAQDRNLISGNTASAIQILQSIAVRVSGDVLGTDRTLKFSLAGGGPQISILHSALVTIGGTGTGAANVADGSQGSGIVLDGPTNLAGPPILLRNLTQCVQQRDALITAIEQYNTDLTSGNLGNLNADQSVIANDQNALETCLTDDFKENTTLAQSLGCAVAPFLFVLPNNSVNGTHLAIDLKGDGVTANHAGGPVFGPNELQNFPVLASATTGGSSTIVTGSLNSSANTDFRIDFYSQSVGTSFRGGQQYLGFAVVHTDTKGNASFAFDSPIAVPVSQFVSATATLMLDADRNPVTPKDVIETSEFSAPIGVHVLVNGVLLDKSTGVLTVAGTSNNDKISVAPAGDGKHLLVKINGVTKSRNILLSVISPINVLGYEGNDAITISNIAKPIIIDGSAGTNSLVVSGRPSAANAFSLGADSLIVNGAAYNLTNLQVLTVNGGSKADSFVATALPIFANTAGAVVFRGAAGVDTLTGPDSTTTWNIAGANAGTLTSAGGALKFTGLESLSGGSGNDTLSYAAIAKAISLNLQTKKATIPATGTVLTGRFSNMETFVGGLAKDTLLGANQSNTWQISGPNAGTLNGVPFNSFKNLIGGTLADTFMLASGGSLAGKIDGAKGTNTLLGSDRDSAWNVTVKNAGKLDGVAFANIQNLTGGSGNDDFILARGVGLAGKVDGGGGLNTLDYSKYTTAVSVNLATGAAMGIFGGAAGGVSNIQVVLGGTAGNSLTGGSGGAVMVGGAGKDTLTGSGGRNILIGGAGTDTVVGGTDEDLLISGTTTFSSNLAVLDALFAYWTGSDDFATRVSNLKAGSIAGAPTLNSASVLDDTSTNLLTGGSGLDWFITKLKISSPVDTISDLDLGRGEQLN